MHRESDFESSNETNRLLEELDQALDQSSKMRDILRRYQLMYDLENLTGPSIKTSSMRQEITRMEQHLRDQFYADSPEPGAESRSTVY